jgi:hypothetical protein
MLMSWRDRVVLWLAVGCVTHSKHLADSIVNGVKLTAHS